MTQQQSLPLRAPSFARFLAVGIALPIVLLGALWWMRLETLEYENLRLEVAESHERQMVQTTLLSRLKDAETAQRGYMITRDPAFLDPYEPARREIATLLDRMKASRHPDLPVAYLNRVEALTTAKLADLDRTIAVVRAGRQRAGQAIVATGRGRRIMTALRETIGSQLDQERRLLAEQRVAFVESRRDFEVLVAVVVVLLSGALLVFLVFLWQLRNDRHAALAAAFEASERKTAILNATVDAILILNPDGTIAVVNAAATRMLGYASDDLEDRDIATIVELTPGAGSFHEQVGLVDGRLARTYLTDRTVLHSDGRAIPVDIAIGVTSQTGGYRLVVSLRDISERKRIERMKDELMSTVSHELRTPLTSIVGSLGLLRSGAVGPLPNEAGRLVDIAENNSRRLIRLINDMLDIDRIESGKLHIARDPIDLRDVIDRACSGSEGLASAHNVRIVCDVPEWRVTVSGDDERLLQVIANLMSNAVRAAPEGSTIDITLETENARDAIVSVKDRGPGIPPAFRDRIFGRFERVDHDMTSGTGLGLAISREIVARHDGRIWFEDRTGGGTCFCFSLALLRDAAVREVDLPRVLVCHPDAAVRRDLCRVVGGEGCLHDLATDADQVRAALARTYYVAAIVERDLAEAMDDVGHLPVLIAPMEAADTARSPVENVVAWTGGAADTARLAQGLRAALARKRPRRPVVLHVDDDRDFLEVVAAALGAEAEFLCATNLAAARAILQTRVPDAVILDMRLADGTGIDLLPLLVDGNDRRVPTMIYSAHDIPCDNAAKVDAVLVKARGSIPELKATLRRIAQQRFEHREQA